MKDETDKAIEENVYSGVLPSNQDLMDFFVENGQEEMAETYQKVIEVCKIIKENGGTAMLVGGAVRDLYLNRIPKDFDIEVYNIEPEKLEELANSIGKVKETGKAFGILKVFFSNNVNIDLSMPRTDSKIESGHTGFEVNVDPYMSVAEAAKRRDFTINSMAYNPIEAKLHDPYSGRGDLDRKILKVTDKAKFSEDPLRVLRGMQFAGRYELTADPETEEIMRKTVPSMKELSGERIFEEWKSLLLKSKKPSIGLELGSRLGVIGSLHPDLERLNETEQEPAWHPEGNVWRHTLMSIDDASTTLRHLEMETADKLIIMLAVLCHDLGKPETTEEKEGKIISHGHESAGEKPSLDFLSSIKADNRTISKVIKLVINHMMPHTLYKSYSKGENVTDGTIRRLATRIYPATIEELVLVSESDHMGRGPFTDTETPEQYLLPDGFPAGRWLLERAHFLGVEKTKPVQILRGRDLIELGYEPSPYFSSIIELAGELHDQSNTTKDEIISIIKDLNANEAIETLGQLLDKQGDGRTYEE